MAFIIDPINGGEVRTCYGPGGVHQFFYSTSFLGIQVAVTYCDATSQCTVHMWKFKR